MKKITKDEKRGKCAAHLNAPPRGEGGSMSEPDVLTTVEWYRSAKHLYTTAIHAMKAYYAYQKKPTPANEKEMQRQFRLLHKALTRFNYGIDPMTEGGAK